MKNRWTEQPEPCDGVQIGSFQWRCVPVSQPNGYALGDIEKSNTLHTLSSLLLARSLYRLSDVLSDIIGQAIAAMHATSQPDPYDLNCLTFFGQQKWEAIQFRWMPSLYNACLAFPSNALFDGMPNTLKRSANHAAGKYPAIPYFPAPW